MTKKGIQMNNLRTRFIPFFALLGYNLVKVIFFVDYL